MLTIDQALLQEFVDKGDIKARSKWKEVYPSFKDDERYLNMLGNPGSNPLELFWDVVDGLDQKLDAKIAAVEGVLKVPAAEGSEESKTSVVKPETTWEEFKEAVGKHTTDEIKALTEDDLKLVFKTVSGFSWLFASIG